MVILSWCSGETTTKPREARCSASHAKDEPVIEKPGDRITSG
jgi:hypothetical protein